MTDAERLAIYGTLEPPAAARELVAGPLSALLDGAALRQIRFGGVEVLRGIAFLMRDANWGTPPTVLSRLDVSETPGRFAVAVVGRIGPEGEGLRLGLRIEGAADGRLTVEADAVPERDLVTNRTGFVVLHPLAGVVGRPMTVEHSDGTRATVAIPEAIAPDQPIFDSAALEHEPADGLKARVTMTGDAYEMEDQRNWTDASLKTYIRPLAKPWPYTLPAGAAVSQRVALTVTGTAPARPRAPASGLEIAGSEGRVPAIGLHIDGGDLDQSLVACFALAGLRPQHLTVRLDVEAPDLAARIAKGGRIAAALGADLTLAFVVPCRDAAGDAAAVAAAIARAGVRPAALIIAPARDLKSRPSNTLPAGEASLVDLVGAMKAAHPGIPVGAGSLTDFTSLNRNRPPPNADFVVHGTQAVVHAADDLSVLATLETFPSFFASVRALAPDKPYRLGPATIGMRENPYAADVIPNPQRLRLAGARRDPRHHARFGAAFALGIMAAAASAGVAVVTLADLVGDFGLLDTGQTPTPLAQLLTALAPHAGCPSRMVVAPAGVAGLAVETPDGPMALIASLRSVATTLSLPPGLCTSRTIYGTSGVVPPRSVEGTVELPPFAALELRAKNRVSFRGTVTLTRWPSGPSQGRGRDERPFIRPSPLPARDHPARGLALLPLRPSYRDVEDLLAERGIDASYETVRRWAIKFGRIYAARIPRRRPRPSDRWHLDEVFVRIGGKIHYLWRAVGDEGEVLDIIVQARRDRKAALKLMRRNCVRPSPRQELPLGHDLSGALDKRDEDVERRLALRP